MTITHIVFVDGSGRQRWLYSTVCFTKTFRKLVGAEILFEGP